MTIEEIEEKYRQGRKYRRKHPIIDWVLIQESDNWVKGAERINYEGELRIRFVYWGYEGGEWVISRLHPIMGDWVVLELFRQMFAKKWI